MTFVVDEPPTPAPTPVPPMAPVVADAPVIDFTLGCDGVFDCDDREAVKNDC